jgi:hypothetical protein
MVERFALILESDKPLLGAKWSCPNGCGRLALLAFEENSYGARGRGRCAGRVAVYLPVVVAVGSLIMIGITLYRDWPQ